MIQLDEDALAGLKNTSRERKLSTAERIAVYAFHLKGVPAKLIARTFDVRPNAVYYITNWTHTAAHENVKNAFEQMGEEKVWTEIVTNAQTESINEGMRKLLQGKPINDRRHSRINRRSPRPRRTRAIAELPETGSDETGGGAPSD
jgi:tRNA U54 and U55 pseudouridine synthase Pus10